MGLESWSEGWSEIGLNSAWLGGVVLLAAAGLDFVLGDPWCLPHPVQAMGKVIDLYSQMMFRLPLKGWTMRAGGVGLACVLIGGSGLLSGYGLWALGLISIRLQVVIAGVLLASCFAGRSLRRAAEDVMQYLPSENWVGTSDEIDETDDLVKARSQLAMYVGRDTHQLSAAEIRRAVLETVSENGIDGVLAPLFYALLGLWLGAWFAPKTEGLIGVVLPVSMAIAYKAASTLDSMVGYREPPYTDLGWFSAKLEDVLTWFPCRCSVMTIALLSGRPWQVLQLCWRDANADPSPNAGWSECAYAAALGVQLGGPNTYRGKVTKKPFLGDANRPITSAVINQALSLTRRSFLIGLVVGMTGLMAIIE